MSFVFHFSSVYKEGYKSHSTALYNGIQSDMATKSKLLSLSIVLILFIPVQLIGQANFFLDEDEVTVSPLVEMGKSIWGPWPGVTSAAIYKVPDDFLLEQNDPNPFYPVTLISYELPVNSDVKLEVYDSWGKRVSTLQNGIQPAGRHNVKLDASGLPGGMYMYRLQAGSEVLIRKMILSK